MHNSIKRCWEVVVWVTKGGRGIPVKMKRSPLSASYRPVRRSINSHQFNLQELAKKQKNPNTITQLHKSQNLFQLLIMESCSTTGDAVSICW